MNRLALSLVISGGCALFSCQQKPAAPAGPTPVNLITVQSKSVLYYDKYPATTVALSQVDIRPQVQGYITGIFFTEGSHVRKGQKLYSIDERLYQAAYDQAAANVKVAEGNQQQAQQDADRYTYLNTHNAVAKQVLDHAVIALQNSKNQVQAAQEAVKTAAANLSYSTITAPFDGTIGFSQVKLGNMVSVGSTVLNTISTDNPMAVDILVNEAQLAHYEDLQRGKQSRLDSLFTIVLPNQSVYEKMGKISVIDRAVDPQTGTIRVRLVFDNPKLDLRAGMSCVLRVHNQETTPQIVIPGKAVIEQMGEYFVFIAKDTILNRTDSTGGGAAGGPGGASASGGSGGSGGGQGAAGGSGEGGSKKDGGDTAQGPRLRAFQVKVMTGQTIGSNVIIQSGIQDGDRVVIDGVQALHDGSPIAIGAPRQGGGGEGRGEGGSGGSGEGGHRGKGEGGHGGKRDSASGSGGGQAEGAKRGEGGANGEGGR